jgi:hypothetical protein
MEDQNLIIGKAKYIGSSESLLKEFGEYTTLYNSEGNYVNTKEGKQVLTNKRDWEEVLDDEPTRHGRRSNENLIK